MAGPAFKRARLLLEPILKASCPISRLNFLVQRWE